MWTLLLALSAAQADDRFFPDEGAEMVSFGALLASGSVQGRTGRLLVQSDDPAALLTRSDVSRIEVRPGGLVWVWPARGVDDLTLARALHGQPGIGWVNPDLILPTQPHTLPDDPFYPDQWHLDNTGQGGRTPGVDINAPRAWERVTGAGVLIAIIDTGMVLDHPDLRVTAGYDYIDDDADPTPTSGDMSADPHGTCAGGVAAAAGNNGLGVAGVAWGADLYAIRLIGGGASLSSIYDAFIEAVDAGAGVVNNSWGWGDGCADIRNYATFRDMFEYAETTGRGGLGTVVVFSAGNGACDIIDDGMLSNESLLVVSAIESNDQRAWYSSYGDYVDLTAPSTLLTTDMITDGYGSYADDPAYVDAFGGTSASAPVVSGVAALLIEANPRITAAQLRQALCDTAVRNDIEHGVYDEQGHSDLYGCGRVDAGAAVDAVYNGAPSAPVPTLVAPEVEPGRAILAWEPAADPDDDVIGYELRYSVSGGEEQLISTAATWVDLGPLLVPGDVVTWTVLARDPWGPSPESAPLTFTVRVEPVATEDTASAPEPRPMGGAAADDEEGEAPEKSGCATVSGELGASALLFTFVALSLRRRQG